MPYARATRPGASRRNPRTSSRLVRSPDAEGRNIGARIRATAQIGMFTKNSQFQLIESTMAPPMTGPRIGASWPGIAIAAIAFCRRVGPALWVRIEIVIGRIMPPPIPCSTPEADEARERPRESAQNRSDEEERDGRVPHLSGTESFRGPAGQRDHSRERQQVAGRDPLGVGDRGVEDRVQVVEGHVDDGGVED